jgi:peptidoglycan-N-acetylglucosamine deacetylase
VRARPPVIVTVAVLLLFVIAFAAWQLSRARTYQLFGELVARVDTTEKVVALTFDDGPSRIGVETVLPLLQEHGIKATFFLIGQSLEENPALGMQLVAQGHEIGNHTYSHRRMVMKSAAFIAEEVTRTDELIRNTGYSGPIYFRPPNGKKLVGLPWYLNRNNRITIMWDVEPESYADVAASAEKIVEHIQSRVRPGSIILLHPMALSTGPTRAALPQVLELLQADGYKFVTVSELLALRSHAK